jgi:hypothetical protein
MLHAAALAKIESKQTDSPQGARDAKKKQGRNQT